MASYSGDLSEEEQAARAREERHQIVLRWSSFFISSQGKEEVATTFLRVTWDYVFSLLRYDQGREDGAVIDDWEDPKFEIYHTQDR